MKIQIHVYTVIQESLLSQTEKPEMNGFDSSDDEDREYDSTPLKIDW